VKRSLNVVAVSAAVLLAVTACGGSDSTDSTQSAIESPAPSVSASPSAMPTPTPTATPTRTPAPAAPAPATSAPAPTVDEAPPGDPGPDAPEMPDPGAPTEDEHDHAPRTKLPADSVLDPDTVAAVVPAAWARAKVPADSCKAPLPAGAAGTLSVAYRAPGATFVETVATYAGARKADAAVAAFGERLSTCGWTATEAPALGSSSVQATRGGETVLMLAAEEGVAVVVRGSGATTADPMLWESLADLAMGSSCPAAPDGCH
jgi:hypothetical protein